MQSAYPYFSVGTGPVLVIPNVGLGFRARRTRTGIDTSLGYSTIGYAHLVQGAVVGHLYLDPWQETSSYFGLGIAGSGFFDNHGYSNGSIGPDFVFGREFRCKGKRRQFLEMHVQAPSWWFDRGRPERFDLPLMFVKYGTSL